MIFCRKFNCKCVTKSGGIFSQVNRNIQLDRSRTELHEVFGAELKAAGKHRNDLENALLAVTTYASWGLWRDHLGQDLESSRRIMHRTVTALFASVGA